MANKQRVFIASSSEGLRQAQAVFSCLEHDTEPSLWTHNLFEASSTFIESLEYVISTHDVGVVIFTPDDARSMRGENSRIPRDNAVFELGLLMGKLGRRNVFIIRPEEASMSLPTDLSGLVCLNYSARQDGNDVASVSTACRLIVNGLSTRQPQHRHTPFWNNVQERHQDGTDLRTQVDRARRQIFVSGISLRYLATYCANQLRAALTRKVIIEVLISSDAEELREFYGLHKPRAADEIRLSHLAWKDFCKSLDDDQRSRISVTSTKIPLTHSIGLYDDTIFLNPFCIGLDSADLPSMKIDVGSPAFQAFVRDALAHLARGIKICGDATKSSLSLMRIEI